MTISSLFIRRPRLAFVVSTVITIAGVLAMSVLPVAQFPDIVPPQVRVTATYPGASAQAVEESVAQVIEGQVNGVEQHDLHEVDVGRRRQLCADRQLRGRLRSRSQHRQRHQPRQPGAGPAAARGAAAGRHHQEAVVGAAAGHRRLLAQGQPRRAVPVATSRPSRCWTRCAACRASATPPCSARSTTRCASGSTSTACRASTSPPTTWSRRCRRRTCRPRSAWSAPRRCSTMSASSSTSPPRAA